MIKNIFFDFDGVIAESVNTKTEAFRELYQPFGDEIARKVVEYHLNHGGVSRFDKFRYYHTHYLNKPISDEEVNTLAKKFSDIVLAKVIQAAEVPGVNAFIRDYHTKLNFWIITGTPTEEIKLIAKKRGITSYFIGLYGSPQNKIYWTEHLIKKHNLLRKETLFLGDAITDYEAAKSAQISFALRETDENTNLFSTYQGIRFKTFNELRLILKDQLP